MLNTIRWATEIRPQDEIKFPAQGTAATALKPAELKMAGQLIADMTTTWKPDAYEDTFASAVHALVQRKVEAGKTERVTPLEDVPEAESRSNVVDLTELLAKSLAGRSAAKTDRKNAPQSKPGPRGTRKKA